MYLDKVMLILELKKKNCVNFLLNLSALNSNLALPIVTYTFIFVDSSIGNRIIRSWAPVVSSQSEYFPYGYGET